MSADSSRPADEHLHLLYHLNQTISSTLDLDEVLNQVMDQVISTIKAERGFVILQDSKGSLDFRAARGLDQRDIEDPQLEVSHGVINKVLTENKPILTLDAQDEEGLKDRESVMDLNLKAVLCAPLLTKGKTLGAIYLENRKIVGAFSKSDLELLNTIAGNAAMAIDNARLFQDAQQKVETLHLLHDISTDLSSALDIQHVLTTSLKRVQESLQTAAGSIMTVEDDELVFQVAIGDKSDKIKPFRIPKGEGIAGWVVENAEGVIVNDAEADPRFFSGADKETGFVTKQLMAAPMIINQTAIGVIEVFNKPGGFTEADLELLNTVAGSAAIALENARLYEVAVEKGRMEKELQMALRVQASLIPDEAPKKKGWEFAAVWLPAREVSGDYYDFIHGQDGKLGLLIADVTGKGMPAALFMAFSRSILRSSLDQTASPAENVTNANLLICEDSSIDMPVTAVYALLDPKTAEIIYVNAGHNPPLHYKAKQGELAELKGTGMLLGAIEEATYEEASLTMESGDIIVFYTDGIPDAINAKKEDYGEERLKEVVLVNSKAGAKGMLKAIEKSIHQFIGNTAPFDDITLMVVKRK
jgi:sigma-B regulation protein RsbU (phosphoserine phosphatase)